MSLAREWTLFCNALMFYTRLPCPATLAYTDANLNRSRKYFPFIGVVVGMLAVLSLLLLQQVLPLTVSVLGSVIVSVLATGAFHEDGLADSCDAFGGGWTPEQVLTIMKDSRLGSYGAVGLLLVLGGKATVLYELGHLDLALLAAAYLNGHVVSRFIASTMIDSHAYVQDIDRSKVKPIAGGRLGWDEWLLSIVTVVVVGLLLPWPAFPLALALAYLVKLLLGRYFQGRIGGYTGDCLGATQQLSELIFLTVILALCNSI